MSRGRLHVSQCVRAASLHSSILIGSSGTSKSGIARFVRALRVVERRGLGAEVRGRGGGGATDAATVAAVAVGAAAVVAVLLVGAAKPADSASVMVIAPLAADAVGADVGAIGRSTGSTGALELVVDADEAVPTSVELWMRSVLACTAAAVGVPLTAVVGAHSIFGVAPGSVTNLTPSGMNLSWWMMIVME